MALKPISVANWLPSVLWHCWLAHLACKNRPQNDLKVSSRTLSLFLLARPFIPVPIVKSHQFLQLPLPRHLAVDKLVNLNHNNLQSVRQLTVSFVWIISLWTGYHCSLFSVMLLVVILYYHIQCVCGVNELIWLHVVMCLILPHYSRCANVCMQKLVCIEHDCIASSRM